jgi:hypothetical protein
LRVGLVRPLGRLSGDTDDFPHGQRSTEGRHAANDEMSPERLASLEMSPHELFVDDTDR